MLNSKVEYISFCGFTDRSKLAFIHSADGKLYLLKNGNYEILPLELTPIKHKQNGWMAIGNMFYTTFQLSINEGVMYVAIDSQTGKKVDNYLLRNKTDRAKQVAEVLFPFRLSLIGKSNPMVYPRIQIGTLFSLLIGLFGGILMTLFRWSRDNKRMLLVQFLFILLTGIYGILAIIVFDRRDSFAIKTQ